MRSPRARQWVGVREYRVYVFTCLRSASPAVDPQPGLEEPPPTRLAERERRGEGQTPELNLSLQIPPHRWESRTAWASPWKPPRLLCMQLSAHNKPSN